MEFESRDFGYFFDAVALTASSAHGFRIERVMTVPLAWQIIDGSVSHHGWVVQLWDGRRAYLEYVVDEAGRRAPERLAVRSLAARQIKPELTDPAIVWFEPRHVNACLASRLRVDPDGAGVLGHDIERQQLVALALGAHNVR